MSIVQKKPQKQDLIVYQAKSGAIEFKGDISQKTLWATQAQIASAFSVSIPTINEHIKNIYKTKELENSSTIRNFRIVQKEGKREVERVVNHYNLDVILSVGYRVNSKKATKFRQWATKILNEYLTKGYALNRKQITKNYIDFLRSVEQVKNLLPDDGSVDTESALELVKLFARTWFSLDAYDKALLPKARASKRQVKIAAADLSLALAELKRELMTKKEATGLFGLERQVKSVENIVGNVFQSFDGKALYPSTEEKAAHLLYFFVKNHPFTDGNKRSGAFAFVWFLRKAGILNTGRMTPEALTALTLLVAESNPKDKDRVIGLVVTLIK